MSVSTSDKKTGLPSYYDRTMFRDLESAAQTSRGITIPKLREVVLAHARDGRPGELSKGEKNALERAVGRDLFATYKGSDKAAELAHGESLSVIGINAAAIKAGRSYKGSDAVLDSYWSGLPARPARRPPRDSLDWFWD